MQLLCRLEISSRLIGKAMHLRNRLWSIEVVAESIENTFRYIIT